MNSTLSQDLHVDHDVSTPENVSFHYEVAGVGGRFIGALVDMLLVASLLLAVNLLLVGVLALVPSAGDADVSAGSATAGETTASWVVGLMLAGYVFVQFGIIWGYFSLFEALWHGKTPGKHLAGTRVVRRDGSPVRPLDVAIRNLVRIIDFLPFGYGLGFLVMVANRQSRRLGDYAAGTFVVHEREAVKLGDIGGPVAGRNVYPRPTAASYPPAPPAYLPGGIPILAAGPQPLAGEPAEATIVDSFDPELARLRERYPLFRRLTKEDLGLLGDTLAREATQPVGADIPQRLAAVLAAKMELPPPSPAVTQAFLADLWRLAERAEALGD